jgi:hypothetical protein
MLSAPEAVKAMLLSRREIDANGCWNWTKYCDDKMGYGQVTIEQNSFAVHRLSAAIFFAFDLASPLLICHHCDNPRCFNPDHLFVGTHADNSGDMVRKGRSCNGETNPNSKLTELDVMAIRQRYLSGESQLAIANDYGVNQTLIGFIVRKVRWKQVA